MLQWRLKIRKAGIEAGLVPNYGEITVFISVILTAFHFPELITML
jgi:hypothetical protein